MKVKVLGCSGSEGIGHNTPGFLVNDTVMLDAGTISAALSLGAQTKITDIMISHPHLDHLKGMLFLADNVIGRIKKPIAIRALPGVITAICPASSPRRNILPVFFPGTSTSNFESGSVLRYRACLKRVSQAPVSSPRDSNPALMIFT